MLGDNRSACWVIWNFHNIHKWCGHKPIIRDREPARLVCDNVHQGKLHPLSLSTYYSPSPTANWWTGENQFPEFFGDWRLLGDSINVTQIYVSTIYFILKQGLFLSKVTCFDLKLVILRPLQHFRYKMLCPLWDPIVFTFVEYILVKTF